MGFSQSVLMVEDLEDYQQLTYLTKQEILHAYNRFCSLDKKALKEDRNAKLPMEKIFEIPELKMNPFKDRICQVFSTEGDGRMNFDDFLDMISIFSQHAPKEVKVAYAFRIYDFDGDQQLMERDLQKLISRLCGQSLHEEQKKKLIEGIFKAADLDGDNALSFSEFEHIISKSPDFINSFIIRL